MTMLVLATAVLLALYLTFAIHALRGRGTKVAGVPKPLWVLALTTFDPLIFGSYLLFVVLGVARGASWRKWVVYGACAFVVLVRFTPLVVPASGAYPQGSARPFAVVPGVELKMTVDYGSANSTASSSWERGNGWIVRDAVIVGDGHPVSAMVVDEIARSLRDAGIRDVRFVQSASEMPAAPADMIVAVSVHDESGFDLIAASHWSGRVQVATGWRPFTNDSWSGSYDDFTDAGGAALEGSWKVSSTRFGPVWGAGYYEHVASRIRGIGGAVAKLLGDASPGGRIEIRSEAADGDWRDPGLEQVFAPYAPQPLLRGAGLFRDAQATWKIELGEDPDAAIQALSARLEQAGWPKVHASNVYRWWQVTAKRDVGGNHQFLRIMPSHDWSRGQGELTSLPTTYVAAFHDRFGDERLRAVALELLESGADDYLLRTLVEHVPDAQYEAWRQQVLAGDASLHNLVAVVRNDIERERNVQAAALLQVAAWFAVQPLHGGGDWYQVRKQLEELAESLAVEMPERGAVPKKELFERAGLPLLDKDPRRVPYLPVQRGSAALSRGVQQIRRFVAMGRDGNPVALHVQRVEDGSSPHIDLGIGGSRGSASDASYIGDGLSIRDPKGRLEVRQVDEHVEVRWVLEDD